MKYLSFITVLILLATLFSFVFTQLNKDETKHEYGIAFPLEESESRLPPLSSVIQSEADAKAASDAAVAAKAISSQPNVESLNEATTTTETVATSTKDNNSADLPDLSVSVSDSAKPDDSLDQVMPSSIGGDNDASIVIEATGTDSSSGSNDTESDGTKDSSEESNDQSGAPNPKLIFIERLMGMNFQRSPGSGFSSFLEMRDSMQGGDSNTDEAKQNVTKTTDTSSEDDQVSKDSTSELPWSNTLDTLRSRWESRIRKFTFPFQNSYSVVLRASSMSEPSSDPSKETSDSEPIGAAESSDADKSAKPLDMPLSDVNNGNDLQTPKYFMTTSQMTIGQPTPQIVPSGQSPQANQLLRMAALSMMSKLFTALRKQAVYSNPKLDSASNRFSSENHAHHDGHDLDLDDDDDDSDSDSDRTPEGLPMPIIIAHRPKINVDASGYGYGAESEQPPMRTAIMYGRPAPAAQQGPIMLAPRFVGNTGPTVPVSPLAAILAAAAARQRRIEAASMPSPQESQPQRLILFITRPREDSPVSPRIQVIPRDEPSYQPSPMAHYAPLTAPSSPIYYHFNPSPVQAMPQMVAQSQPRPQVVEVPVPVYYPMMMRMGRNAAVGPAAIHRPRPVITVPRMMPAEPRGPISAPESASPSGPGHVALLYYHAPEGAESSQAQESMVAPAHPAEAAPSEPESPTGFLRILLRPKMSAPVAPVASPITARLAFHRRLDDSDDDSQSSPVASIMAVHPHPEAMVDSGARLRQWRDYSQFVRSAPTGPIAAAPHPPQSASVAHLLIAATPSASSREDPEPASSEDHYQHYAAQPHPAAPFFMAHHQQGEHEAVAPQHPQQQPPHFMMASHQESAPVYPQAQQQSQGPAGPHAAFFILAEPHGAQQESSANSDA